MRPEGYHRRFTAADAKAAQRALDALAQGGFYGDTGGSKDFAFKDDCGVKPGKVKSLTVSGFHNSCGGCVVSFRDATKGVKGVTGDNAKAKIGTAEVTGEFDAAELVEALNKVGFHVKVKCQSQVETAIERRRLRAWPGLHGTTDPSELGSVVF